MSDTPPAVVPYDDTRRPQVRALTASAVRRQITTAGKVPDEARVHRKDWQADAWSYFRSVGEISFAMFFLGDAISKLRLFVAARPDPKAPPLPADDPESGVDPTAAKLANETLDRLKGDQGGLSQLLKEMEINLEVAGELTLYGRPAAEEKTDPLSGKVIEQARPEETWEILSVSELHTDNGGRSVIVGGAGDRNGRPVAEDDIAIRMWTRDPEFSAQAFCHLRPLLDECETLQILSRDLRATGRSRLAGNGILLVPSELSFGSTDPSAPANTDPFFDDLMTTMTTPIQDEGNAAAVVPLVVRGPADVLEKVRHLTLARPNDAATDIKIENRLVRIANGLNAPLEVVLSHRGTTFANAKVVDQSTFDDHIEPRAVTIVDLLTHGFLRPTLLTPITDGGPPSVDAAEVAKMFIWFDATDLIGSPGQEEKVDKAHEDGVISDEARRRYLGIPETDAPDDDDLLRAMLRRASLDPTMTAEILAHLGVTGISVPERAPTAAPGMTGEPGPFTEAPAEPEALEPDVVDRAAELGITASAAAAAATNTGERVGRRLMQIDRTLRTRLEVAADRAMTRALERAGAKLRAKVGRSGDLAVTVDGIPNAHVAATLGQLVVSGLGFASDDLLNGAFDDLADDCDEWIGGAQANAAGLIGRFSGATPTSLDALALRQQQGRERAREVLIGGLMLLAGQRLFDPSPAAPPLGETDSSLSVPTGVLRDVLSVAGGQTPDGEDGPLWGVATGPDVMGVLSESGGGVEGYEWDYGPADRKPFPPHEDLDGITFESPDDPVLASDGDFPEGVDHLWPGDHSGCAPAGTIVSGPAPRGATLRYHQGEMVTVRFASGQFLSTTPNHPILTDGGWVPSGLLHEGCDVVRCPNPERVADLIPDDHQVPARIEDVAAAFSVSEGVVARRVEIAPMNFHGDGIGSKVGVVWTDSHLRDGADAALVEPVGQSSFAGADPVGGVGLSGSGGGAKHLEGVGDTALGVMGGQGLFHAPLRAELTGGESGGVGETAALHPGSQQALLDRSPVDAVALGDPVLGLTGQVGGGDLLNGQVDVRLGGASGRAPQFVDGGPVAGQATLGQYLPKEDGGESVAGCGLVATEALPVCLDRVIEVEHRRFEGHVYNLQTGTGWYIADGILIHNCVCDVAPRLLPPEEVAGE